MLYGLQQLPAIERQWYEIKLLVNSVLIIKQRIVVYQNNDESPNSVQKLIIKDKRMSTHKITSSLGNICLPTVWSVYNFLKTNC